MKKEIERHYMATDYALDEDDKLIKWLCHWKFTVKAEGAGFVYRSSSDYAPGSEATYTHERKVSASEAAALVRNIAAMDSHPHFTRMAG